MSDKPDSGLLAAELDRAIEIAGQMKEFCRSEYLKCGEDMSELGIWQMRYADCEIMEQALTAARKFVQNCTPSDEKTKEALEIVDNLKEHFAEDSGVDYWPEALKTIRAAILALVARNKELEQQRDIDIHTISTLNDLLAAHKEKKENLQHQWRNPNAEE